MIPTRIIQTHKDPSILRECRETWISHHPHFEYQFYDNQRQLQFIVDHRPELLPTYFALPLAVQRADFFRYIVVHQIGGLYSDADTICMAAADTYIDFNTNDIVLGSVIDSTAGCSHVAQWTFCCPAGHPDMERLIQSIVASVSAIEPRVLRERSASDVNFTINLTGPNAFNAIFINQCVGGVTILPRLFWGCQKNELDIVKYQAHIKSKHLFAHGWINLSLVDPSDR